MLLTLSTTRRPATDLGYLLHKHPDRCQSFELAFGRARVFYPRADDDACTAALLLDVDPIGLVRHRRGPAGDSFALSQYVNDRPYVASSLLSVALARVFGTALTGRCEKRPELVDQPLPLTASLHVVRCRGGEPLLRQLFEPLGYQVELTRQPLSARFPDWGSSAYFSMNLSAQLRLRDLLVHLYVLIPVADDDKHYWVSDDEVDKLLRKGAGWLDAHPQRELIVRRYLKHQGGLVRAAVARLAPDDAAADTDETAAARVVDEAAVETPIRLHHQRLLAVLAELKARGVASVIDLGCGEGKLLRLLMRDRSLRRIVGMDVSHRVLEIAAARLRLDRLPPKQRERIGLLHGSLTYRDSRLSGFDAATVVEVIEHLDPPRLASFERVLFECAAPSVVIVTTPNAEYNVRFPTLPAGRMRHKDHRFEWTRREFQDWCERITGRFGYDVALKPVGADDPEVGPPTQMAVFARPAAVVV